MAMIHQSDKYVVVGRTGKCDVCGRAATEWNAYEERCPAHHLSGSRMKCERCGKIEYQSRDLQQINRRCYNCQ